MPDDIAQLDRQIAAAEAEITQLEQSGDPQLVSVLLAMKRKALAQLQAIRDRWTEEN